MSRLAPLMSLTALMLSCFALGLHFFEVWKGDQFTQQGRMSLSYFELLEKWENIPDRQKITLAGFIGRSQKDDLISIFISGDHAFYQIWELGIPLFRFENGCRDQMNNLDRKPVLINAEVDRKHRGLTNISKIGIIKKSGKKKHFNIVCGFEGSELR